MEVPDSQAVQLAWPAVAWYLPAVQSVQAPAAAALPATHATHAAAPVEAEDEPAAQLEQPDKPSTLAN